MHVYSRRVFLQGLEIELFKLVSYSATPEQWAEWLRVPLEHAVARGNLGLVNRLLRAGANGSAGWRGCRGRTLLDAAALGGNPDVMVTLFQAGAGADANAVSVSSRRSALYTATCLGHGATARELIIAGADVNFQDPVDKRSVLHKAARDGHTELVDDLLEAGADPNIPAAYDSTTALHLAAFFGHDRIASTLLLGGADKDALDVDGRPPLMLAVGEGHVSIAEKLLEAGADLNIRATKGGSTALHWAAWRGYDGIVSTLLLWGADKNAMNVIRETPLMSAVRGGHLSIVEKLLEVGVSVHPAVHNTTALHSAISFGHGAIVSALLLRGADKDALNSTGETPLMWAVGRGHVAIVVKLLEAGANFNVHAADDGSTALHLAAYFGHDGIVSALLLSGADKDALTSVGETPLMWAVRNGRQSTTDMLLAAGADFNFHAADDGSTPLHWAASKGNCGIFTALLLSGANKDALDVDRKPPLIWAVRNGQLSIVLKLLGVGADLNVHAADDKRTALHLAASIGHDEIVRALLLSGVDKDALNDAGETPLMWAAGKAHGSIVRRLLEAGADVSIHATDDGRTALHWSAGEGHEGMVSVLLQSGADKDALDIARQTPLMWAAKEGHISITDKLLEAGADLNIRAAENGSTALHIAAMEGHERDVCALLLRGAEKDALDYTGQTPLLCAARKGHLPVVEKLLEAGADLRLHTSTASRTALHWSASEGHEAILSVLLIRGADKDALDHFGETPLMAAARHDHLRTTEKLLEAGADFSIHSPHHGNTVLHMATSVGHGGILSALLLKGADKDIPNFVRETPMMYAVREGHASVMEQLLEAGADPNIHSDGGMTALHVAATYGRHGMAAALLLGGANVHSRGASSSTVLFEACSVKPVGLEATVDLLLRWGGDETAEDDRGETPMDGLSHAIVPSGNDDGFLHCSPDEVERVRTLLSRAKTWRRRGWLIMTRVGLGKMEM